MFCYLIINNVFVDCCAKIYMRIYGESIWIILSHMIRQMANTLKYSTEEVYKCSYSKDYNTFWDTQILIIHVHKLLGKDHSLEKCTRIENQRTIGMIGLHMLTI